MSTRGTRLHPHEESLRLIIERGALPRCTRFGPVCAPHVPPTPIAAALRSLGATPRLTPRAEALTTLGARRANDRRCFGSIRAHLGDAGVHVEPAVPAARCHLRRAWTGRRG